MGCAHPEGSTSDRRSNVQGYPNRQAQGYVLLLRNAALLSKARCFLQSAEVLTRVMAVSTAKAWKRMVTKVTYVGEGFTRKPPKYERFIRPMAMRFKKAHVTHPELQTTFHLDIIGVKKNPNSTLYTTLGVITKGTVIEVNVSELGLVTTSGKVVWGEFEKPLWLHCHRFSHSQSLISVVVAGKYAQVTNNPERDGCINAVLLV